ncbi:LuxR C-terminal-related transcriptional regulator [Sphingorhabdus contaminans]|jgi:two-component system, NarL family, nitrate/nitrite response regulator NarL|uniref:Response regulator transcription factor n=1 Tax=Sphingorhabdus contaminans TaxID=1343899 RepID=A0A553WAV3_9SPHN|nr:response regulator transcription factor [Sphingorhabdus contaminans]TSB01811.1 response regulator transcription factor [Sphingorhabdus contaminans]
MTDAILSAVVVGKNSLAREGLRRILAEENFSVQASVESGTSFLLANAEDESPNLFILDNSTTDHLESELEALNTSFPKSRKVVLSDQFDLEEVVDAFKYGVDGYIVKEISLEALMKSLRLVAMGEKVMPSQLAQHLSSMEEKAQVPQFARNPDVTRILSEREITTLRYLLVGHANKVIARRLEISEATVKVYVKAILRKLRVSNRTQAAIWAFNNGVQVVAEDVKEFDDEMNYDDVQVAAE